MPDSDLFKTNDLLKMRRKIKKKALTIKVTIKPAKYLYKEKRAFF